MKINRLKMTGYGQQKNKIIEVSDNLNIVLGSSPRAEQTVRDFIEAMFFGMTPEKRDVYRPESGSYEGEMLLETEDGRSIRLVRNFDTNRADVLNELGDDITWQYRDANGRFMLFGQDDTTLYEPLERDDSLTGAEELEKQLEDFRGSPELAELYTRRDQIQSELTSSSKEDARIGENKEKITVLEDKLSKIRDQVQMAEETVRYEVDTLKTNNEEIESELEKLYEQSEEIPDATSRSKLLERNERGAAERITAITRQLNDLYEEQDVYSERLEMLTSRFHLNREELINDNEKLRYAAGEENGSGVEPSTVAAKFANVKPWMYCLMIILGAGVDIAAFMNPGSALNRIAIFILCFIGSFVILGSIALLVASGRGLLKAPMQPDFEPITAVEAVLQKYRKNSVQEFEDFYDKAMKVLSQIDDLEADLQDINAEISEARSELDRYTSDRNTYREDLKDEMGSVELSEEYLDRRERIEKLEKMRDNNEKRISLLEESEDSSNPVVFTAQDGSRLRAQKSELMLQDRIRRLRNENKELAFAEANGSREKLSDEYGELCRRILAAEQKIEALNTRIEERREQDSRIEITEDVLLQKLGVGMQNIIEAGGDVPYLLEDPFTGLKADDKAAMISMFRELTRGKQTLLFTTTNQLKKIYDAMGWPYSGIPV